MVNTHEAMLASLLSLRGLDERRTADAELDASPARADEPTPPNGCRTAKSLDAPIVETPAFTLNELSS